MEVPITYQILLQRYILAILRGLWTRVDASKNKKILYEMGTPGGVSVAGSIWLNPQDSASRMSTLMNTTLLGCTIRSNCRPNTSMCPKYVTRDCRSIENTRNMMSESRSLQESQYEPPQFIMREGLAADIRQQSSLVESLCAPNGRLYIP